MPMSQNNTTILAELIERYQEEIVGVWSSQIFEKARFRPGEHWVSILQQSTRQGLQAIHKALVSGTYTALQTYLSQLSAACLRGGFGCGETTQSLLLCREAVASVAEQALPLADYQAAVLSLNPILDWMVKQFVNQYIAETTRRLSIQHERRLSLLRCSLQTPDTLELNDVLHWTAYSLIADLETECCDFYTLNEADQKLHPHSGMAKNGGEVGAVELYLNRPFDPADDPFLAQVLAEKTPLTSSNIQHDPRVNQALLQLSDIKSMLAIPLVRNNEICMLTITGMRSDYREFTGEQVELAWNIARDAALALENIRRYERQQQASRSVQRVMRMLLQELNLNEILKVVCTETQRLTAAQGSAVFFREDREDGQWFERILYIGSTPTYQRIPVEGSLSGRVLDEGQVYVTNNPAQDSRLFSEDEGIVNMLVAPLSTISSRIGILYAANKAGDFTEDDIRDVGVLANQAALAIEHARLLEQVRYIATLEERERLAREIHDNLAQSLSILKLQASHVDVLLTEGDNTQVRSRIQEMKETASEAHTDAREAIFNLRNHIAPEAEFPDTLQAYLHRYHKQYGLETHLSIHTEAYRMLADTTLIQLTRIIQEALTNVRKHAVASTVWLDVRDSNGQLEIQIEDDGQGFAVDALQAERSGVGLEIMRERAAGLGGTLHISTAPGNGTRILARIPLNDRR